MMTVNCHGCFIFWTSIGGEISCVFYNIWAPFWWKLWEYFLCSGLWGWGRFLPSAVWHLPLPKLYEYHWFDASFNISISSRFLLCGHSVYLPPTHSFDIHISCGCLPVKAQYSDLASSCDQILLLMDRVNFLIHELDNSSWLHCSGSPAPTSYHLIGVERIAHSTYHIPLRTKCLQFSTHPNGF